MSKCYITTPIYYSSGSVHIGNSYVLDEDDQDTFDDLWADMEKHISEMHAKFITGQEDIETGWDAYLTDLERMGLEEILEIYQDAYDAKNN